MKAIITIDGTDYEAKYNVCQGIHGFSESSGLRSTYMDMEQALEKMASRALTSPGMHCESVTPSGKPISIRLSV